MKEAMVTNISNKITSFFCGVNLSVSKPSHRLIVKVFYACTIYLYYINVGRQRLEVSNNGFLLIRGV